MMRGGRAKRKRRIKRKGNELEGSSYLLGLRICKTISSCEILNFELNWAYWKVLLVIFGDY